MIHSSFDCIRISTATAPYLQFAARKRMKFFFRLNPVVCLFFFFFFLRLHPVERQDCLLVASRIPSVSRQEALPLSFPTHLALCCRGQHRFSLVNGCRCRYFRGVRRYNKTHTTKLKERGGKEESGHRERRRPPISAWKRNAGPARE